jgi:protein-S-isoprenylcysteine O-methyltransferase Ste14
MSSGTVIFASWAVFLLVWGGSAFWVKKDIRGGFSFWWSRFFLLRLVVAAGIVFIGFRLVTRTAHEARLNAPFTHRLFTPPVLLGWIGAFFAVLGIVFAIWARVHLGRNWSTAPAVKEHHELVMTGPYAWVRHPIYTGILCAGLGTVLTGNYFGLGMLVLGPIIFCLRIGKEERIMRDLFPKEYPAYQARTKRLIPWVW